MTDTTAIYLVRALRERDDDDAPLWWSNEAGWSTLDYAIVFTEAEQQSLNLPFGGEWVRFTETDQQPADAWSVEHNGT